MLQRLFITFFALFFSTAHCTEPYSPPTPAPKSLYDITLQTIGGIPFPLASFEGKVLLLVNIVTKGPNAQQIGELQTLFETFKDQGFVIIAFPSNDFTYYSDMTLNDIKDVCANTYGVTFIVTSLTKVSGDDKSPIYAFLTNQKTNPVFGLDVTWNFVKFLIDRNGNVVDRFSTIIQPTDERIKEAITHQLKREKVS